MKQNMEACSISVAVAQILAYAKSQGWPDPVFEHEFHPKRKWRWDVAFIEAKVAVEIHGGTWEQGRHTRGGGFEEDRCKVNEGTAAGWRVFEVTYRQIAKGLLYTWLNRAMSKEAA